MKTEFGVMEPTKGLCNLPHTSSLIAKGAICIFLHLTISFRESNNGQPS